MTDGRTIGLAVLEHEVCLAEVCWDDRTGTVISVEKLHGDTDGYPLVFPGFMDIHVHAREYPKPNEEDGNALSQWHAQCRKETFRTVGEAALNGGITLLCAMPNDPLPPADPRTFARKLARASSSPCPIILYACITRASEPWADLPYKIYLDTEPSVSNFDNWSELENAIARYQGCRVFFHAEDPDLLKGVSHTGPRWLTRPPEAEVRAVERVLDLSGKYGLRTHICHVSTRKAVERVVAARKLSSTPLTMEVTPHHLYFSMRDGRVLAEGTRIVEDSSFLGCNPPLREEDDRRYLLDALKDGVIDVLASDHAPHTMQEKMDGAPGMPHLDTLGPFTAWLMARAGVAAHRVREMLATKPAAIFDQELELPRGLLTPGSEASLTIIDHEGLTQVDRGGITGRGPLKTRCGWSPFCGAVFPGRVVSTVVRGTVRHFPV